MLALFAAVVVAGAAQSPPKTERTPNFYHQPAHCGAVHDEVLRRIRTAHKGHMAAQYAVLREIEGCAVPAPVGYHPDYLTPGEREPLRNKPDAGGPPKP